MLFVFMQREGGSFTFSMLCDVSFWFYLKITDLERMILLTFSGGWTFSFWPYYFI